VLCPFCHVDDDRVIDSRSTENGRTIRRRRVCNGCGKRFTTYERAEALTRLTVIKRDGTRQTFDAQKILHGVETACGKLPVAAEDKARLVEEVEEGLYREFDREVESAEIGRRVADRLRSLHHVAYVRFASEYKQFQDLDQIIDEVREVKELAKAEVPGQARLFEGGGAAAAGQQKEPGATDDSASAPRK